MLPLEVQLGPRSRSHLEQNCLECDAWPSVGDINVVGHRARLQSINNLIIDVFKTFSALTIGSFKVHARGRCRNGFLGSHFILESLLTVLHLPRIATM